MKIFSKTRMMFPVLFLLGSTAIGNGIASTPKDDSIKVSTPGDPLSKTIVMALETEKPLIELNFEWSIQQGPMNTGSAFTSTFTRSYPLPASEFTNLPATKVGTSMDYGVTPGNNFIESRAVVEGLKNLNGFTITGWLNCRSSTTGSGGNRIVSWINHGGDGVDLVYRSDGRLAIGIDQWPDSSPAISSPGKIPTDASASVDNWVFFAVTYQSTTSQVQFYFGSTGDASLDVARSYNRGAVGSNIGKLAIGHFNDATRPAALDRMFKGLIDNIRIYGSALSSADIINIQQTSGAPDTERPTPPTLTLISNTSTSALLSWQGATDNVGVASYMIYSGIEFFGQIGASPGNEPISYNVENLFTNTAYSFTVKSVDFSGNISDESNSANVTTVEQDLLQSNTRTGYQALYSNVDGFNNTANGYRALFNHATGSGNTATGAHALFSNTYGSSNNSAYGYAALRGNMEGAENNAFGAEALLQNEAGPGNNAFGFRALYSNINGAYNTAHGHRALLSNAFGDWNTAVGSGSLENNYTGSFNTAIGAGAGGMGYGRNATALGAGARTTASDQVRIGNSNVTSIGGQVSWSTLSDGRFKKDIKDDVSGLDFIDQLRPVSYSIDKEAVDRFLVIPDALREKSSEARKKSERQTGFVAQEVEAVIKKTGYVFHGVEAPKNEQDHYSIRYAEFVVPLVKAVQELNAMVKEQQLLAADQKKEIEELKEQLKLQNGTTAGENASNVEAVLYQNNPNPFSSDTEIKISLPETTLQATLIVYNLEGKELKSYPVQERGNASVKITAQQLQAGMYLYALIVDGSVVDTKRMILTN